jgi:hypothetical protein
MLRIFLYQIPLWDVASFSMMLLNLVTKTGWSLKFLQLNSLNFTNSFLFVIQRADFIKKAVQLGFSGLTEQSLPNELGSAIIQHWNEKIILRQAAQSVVNSYEGILLKTIKGSRKIISKEMRSNGRDNSSATASPKSTNTA